MTIYPAERKEKKKKKGKKPPTQYGFIWIVTLPVALTSKGFLVLFFKRFPANKRSLMNIEKCLSNMASARPNGSGKHRVFPTE